MNPENEGLTDFEWQIEEDADRNPAATFRNVSRRRWPAFALLILALLLAAGLFAWRYLERRAEGAAVVAREQLLATHRLVEQAAAQQDGELLAALLPAHHPAWLDAQQTLLEKGLLLDRRAIGLVTTRAAPAAADDAEEQLAIRLSPDLQQAEVVWQQAYTLVNQQEQSETALLQHTLFYQFDGERWLLSPMGADFWGDLAGSRGERLTLIYFQRDEAVAARLAGDLDAALDQMCRLFDDLDCPERFHLQIRFDNDPASLLQISNAGLGLQRRPPLALPSPTLLGRPLDEAGYQALRRWYAVQVVSAAIVELSGWSCCEQWPLFQALLDRQLSELGLQSWPVGPADYQRLVDEPALWRAARFWAWPTPLEAHLSDDEPPLGDSWLLYAFIDYSLQAAPERSIVDRQRQLEQSADFESWAQYALNRTEPLPVLMREWRQFAAGQLLAIEGDASQPLPAQEIVLACWATPPARAEVGEPAPAVTFWRVRPGDDHFVAGPDLSLEILPPRSRQDGYPYRSAFARALPDYQGILIQAYTAFADSRRTQIFRWEGGEEVDLILDSDLMDSDLMAADVHFIGVAGSVTDPAGELLLLTLTTRPRPSYTSDAFVVGYVLAEMAACEDGLCPLRPVDGMPVWSPDGSQTILVSDAERAERGQAVTLLHGDRMGEDAAAIGEGYAPVWLAEDIFGYFQRRPAPGLYRGGLAVDGEALWLDFSDLADVPGRPDSWIVQRAQSHPAAAERLFLLADGRQRHIFSYDGRSGEAVVYHTADQPTSVDFHLSPDGRWLVIVADSPGSEAPALHFHDLSGELPPRQESLPRLARQFDWHNWSPGGDWFIVDYRELLMLYAPATGEWHIQPQEKNCFFAGWRPVDD